MKGAFFLNNLSLGTVRPPEWPNRYSNPVALLCDITFSVIWRGVAGESRYTQQFAAISCRQKQAKKQKRAGDIGANHLLGRHVCRGKLARSIVFSAETPYEKRFSEIFPKFLVSICGSENPANIPPNVPLTPTRFPCKTKKNSLTDALLQVRFYGSTPCSRFWLGSVRHLQSAKEWLKNWFETQSTWLCQRWL